MKEAKLLHNVFKTALAGGRGSIISTLFTQRRNIDKKESCNSEAELEFKQLTLMASCKPRTCLDPSISQSLLELS